MNIKNILNKLKSYFFTSPERDPLFDEAIKVIAKYDMVGVSHLQKELMIGYARGDKIINQLQNAGFVSLPPTGLRRVFRNDVEEYISNPKEYKRKQKKELDDFLNHKI